MRRFVNVCVGAVMCGAGWIAGCGPTPPITGSGGSAGTGGTVKEVVTLGDSYMRLPDPFQQPGLEGVELSLERAAGRTYRKYGYTGGGAVPIAIKNGVIPGQFQRAKTEDPNIATVVIAGGGNDLTDDCSGPATEAALSATCKTLLDDIEAATQAMISQMAAAGVQDVVWVGYGDTATTGPRVFAGALDYLRRKRIEHCTDPVAGLALRCHYVDNKGRAGLVTRDGFHPDPAGYDLIGRATWERMVAEDVRR